MRWYHYVAYFFGGVFLALAQALGRFHGGLQN